jgi:hypothetical protein
METEGRRDRSKKWNKVSRSYSRRKKKQAVLRGRVALNSTDRCLVTAPNIRVELIEQTYVSLVEWRMMAGMEIWWLKVGWRMVGKTELHETFASA